MSRDATGWFKDDFGGAVIEDVYDYVIVGGGTAGCVMAARLSEDPEVRVLLLEAGGATDTDLNVRVVGKMADLQLSEKDWQFKAAGGAPMNNRTLFIPRGKVLGGCSSINACAWVRGDPDNFDGWARSGCTGWSYDQVLPYFKKLENCQITGADYSVRGKGGPVNVVDPDVTNAVNPLTTAWLKGCREAGLPMSADYNTRKFATFGFMQSNTSNGWRHSTAAAYLREAGGAGDGNLGVAAPPSTKPAAARSNLTVATLCHATKLVFQGQRAVGVRFKRGSSDIAELRASPELYVAARREVILCAGAINSPWLLMVSGVGPAAQLRKFGIDVVADLPVGENLQDHLFCSIWWKTKQNVGITADMSLAKARVILQFFLQGKGEGMVSPLQGTGFADSGLEPHSDDYGPKAPDHQIHFIPFTGNRDYLVKSNIESTGAHTNPANVPLYGTTMMPTLLRPRSRGRILLRSADPLEYPEIDFRFLTHERDVQVLIKSLRVCRQIAKSKAFAELVGDECTDESIPHPPESDEYLREYIKRTTITVYHPVGTCRMGDPRDSTTVVDPRCRVVGGVTGLRVVDAAAMPFLTSGNTCAPVIMMAEKAADMVKDDARRL